MALIRLILLFALLGGFGAFAVQNTTLLPLVILGQRTISLPLWAWLAGALGLGVFTSIFLNGLIQWTAFWSRRHERKVMRSVPSNSRNTPSNQGWGNPFGRKSAPAATPSSDDVASPRPAGGRSADQPPAPPKEVVDADFRVIRPPFRNLEDE